jgi:hypothetical protein
MLESSNPSADHSAGGKEWESSPPAVAGEASQYFADEVAAPSVAARYKVGMFLVSGAIVLLPLIYLGLIALLGFGLYAYATGAYDFFFPEIGGRRLAGAGGCISHCGSSTLYLFRSALF